MKLYAPSYYKDFVCKADQCQNSCCIGWEIDVDEKSFSKFNTLSGTYSNTIRESIAQGENPHFILGNNDRCPHLNECGLCNIILNVGEEYLCDICREHPRFYNYTNRGKEVGIGMSCEEACRIILSSDDFDDFVLLEDTDGEIDACEFDALQYREELFGFLKNSSFPFSQKVAVICKYYDLPLDEERILDCLGKLEYLDESHKKIFLGFSLMINTKVLDCKLNRALAYFIYRHCSEALNFEELRSSLSFSLICTLLIASISDSSNIEDMARIVSEELEYSLENTEAIKYL